MSRKIDRCSWLGILVFVMPQTSFAADVIEATKMHHGVKAKSISRRAPHYPQSELRRGRQGWVQLSYVVTADGKIIDPVIENSSGSQAFETEALRTVKYWSYEPATWDGKPVQQCHNNVMINFAMQGAGTGVTKKFNRRYKKIGDTITGGELAKAQQMIDSVDEELNLSLSETAWLGALQARLSGLTGDKDAQLAALRKATRNSGSWVYEKLYPNLLLVKTALEFENGNYSEALSNHDELIEAKFQHPQLEKLEPYVKTVRDFVASDNALSIPAQIGMEDACVDCATNWHYHPLRRKFSLANISGKLRDIEFRCTWQRVVDKAHEGSTWEVPEDWGDCSIVVFGERGATFDLLELPDA